jgi:hypothetical protein
LLVILFSPHENPKSVFLADILQKQTPSVVMKK